jgi:hypothetical protein
MSKLGQGGQLIPANGLVNPRFRPKLQPFSSRGGDEPSIWKHLVRSIRCCSAIAGITVLCAGCARRDTENKQIDAFRQRVILKWQGQLVRRPGNTPEDGKVYLIEGGQKRWIDSGQWLALHGYNIVADVKVIPSEELAVIPSGEDIEGPDFW